MFHFKIILFKITKWFKNKRTNSHIDIRTEEDGQRKTDQQLDTESERQTDKE